MRAPRSRDDARDAEFTEFVTARQATLRRIAWVACGDPHRAEDVLQDALVKLYVAWPRVRRDGGEEAYARRIIVRAAVDAHRRPWRRERPVDADSHPGLDVAGPTGLDLGDRSELFEALQRLPAMQRQVVVLRHWLGLSVEETAADLGISAGTVKSHTSRALAALRGHLEPADVECT